MSNLVAMPLFQPRTAGASTAEPRFHSRGTRAAIQRSSRSWENSTVPTPRARAHSPAASSVVLSDTSTDIDAAPPASASSSLSTARERGITRYPPPTGTPGTVITSPASVRLRSACRPGTTRIRSWPRAAYPRPSVSTTVRSPPEIGL